jgi:hypothetical protein
LKGKKKFIWWRAWIVVNVLKLNRNEVEHIFN